MQGAGFYPLVSYMTKPPIVIVGAGPTGLLLACQLAMRNIDFRIIDKTDDHTTQSRAIVIHARSLEILQQMGLAEEAIEQGKIAKAANLIINGKRKLRFPLGNIASNLTDFPFLLMLEQSRTEALLLQFLKDRGKYVERNIELLEFFQDDNRVSIVIKNKNGEKEIVETRWLIGADGAHSKVREQLGIPFPGKTYVQSLFVLDCEVSLGFPPDEMYISFSSETFAGFFPLTNGRCRVIGLVPEELEQKEELTFEDIDKNFAALTRLPISLRNPNWISKYHSHHRVVGAFRKGRCFLAGDAAHIHSPVGAQGMNTGLQDAYNLAWKLALVVSGEAPETLLSSYEEERIGIAKKLVKTTDRAFNIVTNQNRFSKLLLTKFVPIALKLALPIAEKIPSIGKKAFVTISGIDIRYRNSKLSRNDEAFPFKGGVKPGDRVPYNLLRKELIKGTGFHLLVFSKQEIPENIIRSLQMVCIKHKHLIAFNQIPFTAETEEIYSQFGIINTGLYLIRPDSYIGYRSASLGTDNLETYLVQFLNC